MATITVLGIGNTLMRDEGLGVLLLEAVRAARPWPGEVEFIDGGVGGLNLLNVIEQAEQLVVFDAADMGLPPGEFRIFTPEQVEAHAGDAGRMSLHEVPFLETLSLCERYFRRPPTVILGVQPAEIGPGMDLSDTLTARWPALVEQGAALVEQTHKRTHAQ
jgi:hydrogenase maturation protease